MRAKASANLPPPNFFTSAGSKKSLLVLPSQIDQARAAFWRTRRSGLGRRLEEGFYMSPPPPDRPGARRLLAHAAVGAGEALVVGLHHVAPLAQGDRREIVLPRVGKDLTRPLLVEPEELAPSEEEDASQHERLAAIRVRLGVCQRKGAAPAPAENDPPVDA